MDALKPKSLQQVWDTGVLDKPNPHVHDMLSGDIGTSYRMTDFDIAARQELLRRHMGLPVRPEGEIFRDVGQRDFHPSATSGGVPGRFDTVELDPKNVPYWSQHGLGGLIGASQGYAAGQEMPRNTWDKILSDYGLDRQNAGGQNQAHVYDLWDFKPSDHENTVGKKYLSEAVRHPMSLAKPVDNNQVLHSYGKDVQDANTQGQFLGSLASRYLLNNVLGRGGVVFDQKINAGE